MLFYLVVASSVNFWEAGRRTSFPTTAAGKLVSTSGMFKFASKTKLLWNTLEVV